MARKPREVTPRQLECIACAISRLQVAREFLCDAGACNAAAYVARAIKSAEGAKRHAEGLVLRQAQAGPACPNARWGPFCVYGTRLGQGIFLGYANTESGGQGIARIAIGGEYERAEVWHKGKCVWQIARPVPVSSKRVLS